MWKFQINGKGGGNTDLALPSIGIFKIKLRHYQYMLILCFLNCSTLCCIEPPEFKLNNFWNGLLMSCEKMCKEISSSCVFEVLLLILCPPPPLMGQKLKLYRIKIKYSECLLSPPIILKKLVVNSFTNFHKKLKYHLKYVTLRWKKK